MNTLYTDHTYLTQKTSTACVFSEFICDDEDYDVIW